MTDITIPPEAAKALADAIYELTGEGIDMAEARAAFLAMLKAWPGMDMQQTDWERWKLPFPLIILPLTENTDGE